MKKINIIYFFIITQVLFFILISENNSQKLYNLLNEAKVIQIIAPSGYSNEEALIKLNDIANKYNLTIVTKVVDDNNITLYSNSNIHNELLSKNIGVNADTFNNMKNIEINRDYFLYGNTNEIDSFIKELKDNNYNLVVGTQVEQIFLKSDIIAYTSILIFSFITYFVFLRDIKFISIMLLEGINKFKILFRLSKSFFSVYGILILEYFIFYKYLKNPVMTIYFLSIIFIYLFINSYINNVDILKGIKKGYGSKITLAIFTTTRTVLKIVIVFGIGTSLYLAANIYNTNKDMFAWKQYDSYTIFSEGVNASLVHEGLTTFPDEEKVLFKKAKQFYVDTNETYGGVLIQDMDNENVVIVNDNYLKGNPITSDGKEVESSSCDQLLVPKNTYTDITDDQFLSVLKNKFFIGYGDYNPSCEVDVQRIDNNLELNPYYVGYDQDKFTNNIILVDNTNSLPEGFYGFAMSNSSYMLNLKPEDYYKVSSYDPIYFRDIILKSSQKSTKYNDLVYAFKMLLYLSVVIILIYILFVERYLFIYFSMNSKLFSLKYIEGLTLFKIHKKLIIKMIVENVVLLVLFYIFLKSLIYILIFITIVEIIFIIFYSLILHEKQVKHLLNGGII